MATKAFWSYDPKISFGNILAMISMVGTLIGIYVTLDTRLTRVETNVTSLQNAYANAEVRNRASDEELRRSMDRVDNKLSMLTNTLISIHNPAVIPVIPGAPLPNN